MLIFFLIFTRWISLILISPILGSRILPPLIKVALASLFSIMTFILLQNNIDSDINLSFILIFLLFLKEALIGFILGFFLSLIFFLYELAGQWMDFGRSASSMIQMVPSIESQSSILGNLMFYLILSIFFSLGLHEIFLSEVLKSFFSMPILSFPPLLDHKSLFIEFLKLGQYIFKTGFILALPVIAFSFLLDMSFGLLNRLVPEINAYFLSLPLKTLMGLVILLLALPVLLEKIFDIMQYLK